MATKTKTDNKKVAKKTTAKPKKKTNSKKTNAKTKPFKFTPDQLMEKFLEYRKEKGFETFHKFSKTSEDYRHEEVRKYMPITDVEFCFYLGVHKKYLYELPEQYNEVLEMMNDLREMHINRGIACGDITASWGIFYLKNKFGYRDVKQIDAEVKQEITTNNVDYTDDQLLNILGKIK